MHEQIFPFSRILISIFSISVWHQHINELASNGSLESNQCRMFNGWFLAVILIHFLYTGASFYLFKPEMAWYYAIFNIIFGAYILMALKPNQWYFSFKWSDCNVLYNNNDVIGRAVMLSYVLLVLGAIEILYLIMNNNINEIFKKGISIRDDIEFSLEKMLMLFALMVVLFLVCLFMVWVAGGL